MTRPEQGVRGKATAVNSSIDPPTPQRPLQATIENQYHALRADVGRVKVLLPQKHTLLLFPPRRFVRALRYRLRDRKTGDEKPSKKT